MIEQMMKGLDKDLFPRFDALPKTLYDMDADPIIPAVGIPISDNP